MTEPQHQAPVTGGSRRDASAQGSAPRSILPESHARSMVDAALEDSFPASDPPPWTPGIATLAEAEPGSDDWT